MTLCLSQFGGDFVFGRRCPQKTPQRARVCIVALSGDAFAVSLMKARRGEICHDAMTDGQGRLARVKMVDPSSVKIFVQLQWGQT